MDQEKPEREQSSPKRLDAEFIENVKPRSESSFDKGFNGTLGAIAAVIVVVGGLVLYSDIRAAIKRQFNSKPAATERE
jgi:hypothetical protein